MEEREASYFHFLVQGSAYFSLNGSQETRLSPGDVLLLPQRTSHRLRHSIDSHVVTLEQIIESAHHTQSDVPGATTLLCGYFGIDRHMVMPAIKSLPPVLHLRVDSSAVASPVGEILKQLRNEIDPRWRLGIAVQLLSQPSLSIGEIAGKVRYQSEYRLAGRSNKPEGARQPRERIPTSES